MGNAPRPGARIDKPPGTNPPKYAGPGRPPFIERLGSIGGKQDLYIAKENLSAWTSIPEVNERCSGRGSLFRRLSRQGTGLHGAVHMDGAPIIRRKKTGCRLGFLCLEFRCRRPRHCRRMGKATMPVIILSDYHLNSAGSMRKHGNHLIK